MKTFLMAPRFFCALFSLIACSAFAHRAAAAQPSDATLAGQKLNNIAEAYVKLVLAVGQHDADYVDAYYGPPAWREEAQKSKRSLGDLQADVEKLQKEVESVDTAKLAGLEVSRHRYLLAQLRSMSGRIALLAGEKLSFDEEAQLLYDAKLPEPVPGQFDAARARLEKMLPGEGALSDRLEKYQNRFVVPKDRVDAVMQAAIAECRRRTLEHIALPNDEAFKMELVTGKSWSAYNWYKGGAQSLIQINVDLPFRLSSAIHLAAHEGYPGHHVNNVLLEQELVRKRGWCEFQVYALFSPPSLLAEGSAEFGVEVVFPEADLKKFMREVLFPLAGFGPDEADRYCEVTQLVSSELALAGDQISRAYADGKLSRAEAIQRLSTEALVTTMQAGKYLDFVDHYRAYVANYSVGRLLVKHYVESHGGKSENTARRWALLSKILSTPCTAADLR